LFNGALLLIDWMTCIIYANLSCTDFFFLNRQNIINQQARARRTKRSGGKKKQLQGKIGCHKTPA